MIPGLPKWDETDNVSKPYQGSQIKPPPEKWWKHFALSLGPKEYGVHGGDLAARWWAVYIQPLNNFQAIWIVPARLDGLGWDRPRLFHTFSYARFTETAALGFNKNGHAVVSILHTSEDYYGPPNSITTYSFGLDYSGNPGISEKYIMNVRCPVVANSKPTDADAATYLFFINNANVLSYVSDQGTGTIDFTGIVTSSQLGASWEILHGGYRVDGKFQLAYRHDVDDPYPEQPVLIPLYDSHEVVSPPFKFVKVATSQMSYGFLGNGQIKDTAKSQFSDTVALKGPALASVVVKQPQVKLIPTEPYTPALAKVGSVTVRDPSIVQTLPTENLALPTNTLSVVVDTIRVNSNATDTVEAQPVTISNVSLITL